MQIVEIIEKLTIQAIKSIGSDVSDIVIEKPAQAQHGDYAVNVFALAKELKKNPQEIAQQLADTINADKPEEIDKVEVAGGYVNFFITPSYIQQQLSEMNDNYGTGDLYKGKTVMVEFTDPNPFKEFHIGHLMSNAIGESVARLYESQGAKVVRANYYGDVGMHVAKAIWGAKQRGMTGDEPITDWAQAYAQGAKEYENNKEEINALNKKIYDRSDDHINALYDAGKKTSLEYFETIYEKLGTKFDNYYPESEVGGIGLQLIEENPDVFTKSDGAIVFKGEDHGLHTRVFVNKLGLPTYEAKELGLNKQKNEDYKLDTSIIVTGNEITEYFKVLLKAMELVIPEVAQVTSHLPHGMMRLTTGKMSSRTGNVVTGESLLQDTEQRVGEIVNERELDDATKTEVAHQVSVAAIKYPIVKTSIGSDIAYDSDKAVAFTGDSGPYIQYTYARLGNIVRKAGEQDMKPGGDATQLTEVSELEIIKHMMDFPSVVQKATQAHAPNNVAHYIYELANLANSYYEHVRILEDDNNDRLQARLLLVQSVMQVLKQGLHILGIKTLDKI